MPGLNDAVTLPGAAGASGSYFGGRPLGHVVTLDA